MQTSATLVLQLFEITNPTEGKLKMQINVTANWKKPKTDLNKNATKRNKKW